MKFEVVEREKKETRRKLLIAAAIIGIMCLAILGIWILVTRITEGNVDTTKGLAAIQKLESTDVAEVEKRVEKLEEKTREEDEAEKNRTPNEKFVNALVLGDSITQGLSGYDILDDSKVIADRGVDLEEISGELSKAEALNPKYLFLCYGMNDIKATYGDASVFKERYQKTIKELKQKLPDTKIYVNSILPVQKSVIAKTEYYAKQPEFNEALEALCQEEDVTYIDNTDLVKSEFYAKDGIHMNPDYYPLWAEHMAEVAEL